MNIRDQYFRASFNGVDFSAVKGFTSDTGRSLSVKTVINGGYTVEDTGDTPRVFSIEALVITDGFGSWRDKAEALESQLRAGRGKLIHPQLGELDVYPESWTSENTQDAHLQQKYTIRFIEEYIEPQGLINVRETFLGRLVNDIADLRMRLANSPFYDALGLVGQQRQLLEQVFSESLLFIENLGAPAEVIEEVMGILNADFNEVISSAGRLVDTYISVFDFLISRRSGFSVQGMRNNVLNSSEEETIGILNSIIVAEWVNTWLRSFIEFKWEDKVSVEDTYRDFINLMSTVSESNISLYGLCVDLKDYIDNDLRTLYDIEIRQIEYPRNIFDVSDQVGVDADLVIADNLFMDLSKVKGGVSVRTINT